MTSIVSELISILQCIKVSFSMSPCQHLLFLFLDGSHSVRGEMVSQGSFDLFAFQNVLYIFLVFIGC
jgi:hypothetical protein